MSFCQRTGHGVWQSVSPYLLKSSLDTLLGLTKVMTFLKNYSGVFLRAIFFDVNSDPREHF